MTKIMLAFIASLAVVMLGMPSLIRLAVQKNLLDDPSEDRKVHTRSVPRLGGVLVFIGTLVTTTILVSPEGETAVSFLRLAAAATISGRWWHAGHALPGHALWRHAHSRWWALLARFDPIAASPQHDATCQHTTQARRAEADSGGNRAR